MGQFAVLSSITRWNFTVDYIQVHEFTSITFEYFLVWQGLLMPRQAEGQITLGLTTLHFLFDFLTTLNGSCMQYKADTKTEHQGIGKEYQTGECILPAVSWGSVVRWQWPTRLSPHQRPPPAAEDWLQASGHPNVKLLWTGEINEILLQDITNFSFCIVCF